MNRHASPVQNDRLEENRLTSMSSSSMQTTAASTTATRRVRECKAQLYRALQRRHRDAWRTYWAAFQQYLGAKLSIQQFQATAERLMGAENIMLHNAFVVALLQDCSDPGDINDTDDNDTGGSSSGGSETSGDIKVEPTLRHYEAPDTESAELLIGLGRSMSR